MVTERPALLQPIVDDLQSIFGERLLSLLTYGWRTQGPVSTLALVASLDAEDLYACAGRAASWRRKGLATPLLLTRQEFARSLDVFPIEYGEIIDHHRVLVGQDPFAGLAIDRADLRRACEVQVKSHLLHLREDYIESGARHGEVSALVRESAPAFAALLRQLARLHGDPASSPGDLVAFAARELDLPAAVVGDVLSLADNNGPQGVDAVRVFPAYLAVVERLADVIDRWRHS